MAISTSFSNFFSFLSLQTKPQPPSQLPLFSHFPSHLNNHRNNKIIPLVLSRNETSSSVTTSPPPPPPPPLQDISSDFTSSLSDSEYGLSKGHYNVIVAVEDDEPEERLLNRFRREVMRAGIIQQCKRRMFFENKQDKMKRKVREAAKRNRRNRFPRRPFAGKRTGGGRYNNYRQDDPQPPVKEEDDDNWDLPGKDELAF